MSPPNPLPSAVDEEEEEFIDEEEEEEVEDEFIDEEEEEEVEDEFIDEEEEEEVEDEFIDEEEEEEVEDEFIDEEEEEEVEEEFIEEEEEEEEEEKEVIEEEEEVQEVEEEAEEKEDDKAVEREQENQVEKRDAFSEFARQWDGLMRFLDRIGASIDAHFKELGAMQTLTPSDKANDDKEKVAAAAVKEEAKSGQEKPSLDDLRAELHSICQTMGSRFLRKLVASRLSDLDWLRREVPAALRRAPNPAKLVFDSIYLQGSKAYENHRTAIDSRRASILILEFYVLAGLPSEADSSVKQDARVAALTWRDRLEEEGGVKSASVVDALGLVLFVGSFGIPPDFGCEVMYDLLCLSNLKKKADVFQQSPILREKIPDIIKGLLSKDMHAEAVHLVCAFGLKEKFPPLPLLSSVIHKSWQTVKEELRGRSSLESVKEAKEKQLAVFKSVVKCVEDNKLDPSEITSYDIYQKIAKLEKHIAKIKQKLKSRNLKRKAEEIGPLEKPETPAKRPWPASAETSPGVTPHLMMQIQEHRGPPQSDSKGLYTGFIPRSMYCDGFKGLHTGSGAGLLPGSVPGSAGASSSLEATAASDSARLTPGNTVGSYANISGGSHRWHRDGALDERPFARSYSGFAGFAPSGAWMGPLAAATQSLYQPQASSLGIEARRPISDLYKFVDMVLERESYSLSTSNASSTGSNTIS